MIKVINDEIIATIFGAVLILNGDLKTIRRFNGIKRRARAIDGNEDYISVTYDNDNVLFFTRNSDEEPTVSLENTNKKFMTFTRFTTTTVK